VLNYVFILLILIFTVY